MAQSLFRAALWCSLGLASWVLRDEHRALLLAIFFLVVTADATAAGVGNIAFNDTLARVIPRRLQALRPRRIAARPAGARAAVLHALRPPGL